MVRRLGVKFPKTVFHRGADRMDRFFSPLKIGRVLAPKGEECLTQAAFFHG